MQNSSLSSWQKYTFYAQWRSYKVFCCFFFWPLINHRGWSEDNCPSPEGILGNTHVNSSVKVSRKHSEHFTFVVVCAMGEGGPRWRGTNEELTGLLDCSMSLCSHIFRRRSRSFNSCSLVLRSLSSFLSLSSVASISHLHVSAAKQRYRYIKAYYDASVCHQLQWDQKTKLTMLLSISKYLQTTHSIS